ncbi:hypothetical protein [Dysosmobacter sp.]|uniref:hypothetical protein n=1 Tax=Dysosmobacter sp. TaxID=2591382 RepID=UPI002A8AAB30|nr:hypothetical protein [Dysosmobacter sp.]MDY3281266.1 hypothetical protein [Dysosmobacter sp.]
MRWLNRHPLAYSAAVCLLAAAAVLAVTAGASPLLLAAVPAVCWCLRKLPGRLLLRELGESGRALTEECDPEPLERTCREIAESRKGGRKTVLLVEVQLLYADAVSCLGRFDEAERELDRVLFGYEQYDKSTQLLIEMEASEVKLRAGKPADALSYLREAEKKVHRMEGLPPFMAASVENRFLWYRLVTEGGSQELLEAFQKAMETAASRLDRVCGHMNIARCLLSMGRREEARPHLEFAAEQGNKLYLRREAQQALAELP